MKRTALIFLALLTILIASTGAFAQKRLLADTKWRLIEANRETITATTATMAFDTRGSAFSGNTGCNAMSGTVDVRGKNIDFGPVRTTKRACKLRAGSVAEEVVLSILDKARRFDVRNDSLRLYDRRGRVIARFEPDDGDAVGGPQLETRKWVLEQIKGRQTFVPLPHAFLNFDAAKGAAGGDTSCNVFGGSYTVKGNKITFSDIISTMRACEEDNRMSVERDFLGGLRAATRFETANGRLMLYKGNELLLTFRGEKK